MGYLGLEKDKKYMELALEIAFKQLGKTSPNPPVGAVIVKNDNIVSTGGTSLYGQDHAEIVAIRNAGTDLEGSEIYVSLEPCSHYGKTPPCTEAIIQSKISKVYIPLLDPNPIVAGKGVARLQEVGVEIVVMKEMAFKAYELIRHFKKYILKNRAYVLQKNAISLDGKIATLAGDSKWISSDYSRFIVHKLRSIVDAVVIGKNTLIQDNPTLNIRFDSFSEEVKRYINNIKDASFLNKSFFLEMLLNLEENEDQNSPLRVIVGLPERIDTDQKIFFDNNFIFFSDEKVKEHLIKREDYTIVSRLINNGQIQFIKGDTRYEQVSNIVGNLSEQGKIFIMLEGGGVLSGSFLSAGEIDQFLYFISPKIIGEGISPITGSGVKTVQGSMDLYDISAVKIKDDILYNAYKCPFNNNSRE
ncbi:MAG: bifunctional diaminohydroxyphosphoribosylaminopyrimidine deaminase/5-amino-6-(5-phosphoribosylamino)uracil reductase RibD [Spirochaetota bacterium]|nr:bifunctional diaminohydroxyphosphoribosylaminopyrimidine deaminase/5-amino-6-(5-phosphoribosylamino)uracil reductase RibD [Spirochaetota bacterium]